MMPASLTFVLDISVKILLCTRVLEDLLDLWICQTFTYIIVIINRINTVYLLIKVIIYNKTE